MFSDRINGIDLMYFTGCGVHLEKRPDEAARENAISLQRKNILFIL